MFIYLSQSFSRSFKHLHTQWNWNLSIIRSLIPINKSDNESTITLSVSNGNCFFLNSKLKSNSDYYSIFLNWTTTTTTTTTYSSVTNCIKKRKKQLTKMNRTHSLSQEIFTKWNKNKLLQTNAKIYHRNELT